MSDYKKMYLELLIGMEQIINVSKEAMLQAEEIYIETADKKIHETPKNEIVHIHKIS